MQLTGGKTVADVPLARPSSGTRKVCEQFAIEPAAAN
jgi:hypothetical protein